MLRSKHAMLPWSLVALYHHPFFKPMGLRVIIATTRSNIEVPNPSQSTIAAGIGKEHVHCRAVTASVVGLGNGKFEDMLSDDRVPNILRQYYLSSRTGYRRGAWCSSAPLGSFGMPMYLGAGVRLKSLSACSEECSRRMMVRSFGVCVNERLGLPDLLQCHAISRLHIVARSRVRSLVSPR